MWASSPRDSASRRGSKVTWASQGQPSTRRARTSLPRLPDRRVAHFRLLPCLEAAGPLPLARAARDPPRSPSCRARCSPWTSTRRDVLALVGGYDYGRRASSTAPPRRGASRARPSSPSSTVRRAYEREGYTPVSIALRPAEAVYEDPRHGLRVAPQNYGRQFYGPITHAQAALAKSVNNATCTSSATSGVDYGDGLREAVMGIESRRSSGDSRPGTRHQRGRRSLELTARLRGLSFNGGTKGRCPTSSRRVIDRDGRGAVRERAALGASPWNGSRTRTAEVDVEDGPGGRWRSTVSRDRGARQRPAG